MSAVIPFPFADRLQRDMAQVFGQAAPAIDLREARIRREREASERKFRERHGFDPDPDLPGAA